MRFDKEGQVQSVFGEITSRHRRVDVLVNLAGGTLHARLIQVFALREWQEVIDVNLKGTFLCCQAVIPIMKRQGEGCIINTSSNFGITGSPTRTAYSASKTAVIAFTKSLALELACFDIRVNAIAPGLTATQRVMAHQSPETWAQLLKKIPVGGVPSRKTLPKG